MIPMAPAPDVVALAKAPQEDWKIGAPIFWDDRHGLATVTAGTGTPSIGTAAQPARSDDAFGVVRLTT